MPHFLWVIRQGQICAWRFFCALLVMKSNPDSTQIFTLLWGEVFCNYRNSYFSTQEKCIGKVMVMTDCKKSNNKYHLLSKIWQLCKKICAQWRMGSLGSVGTCTITFTYCPKWNKTENAFQLDRGKKKLVAFQSHIFRSMRHLCIAHSIWKSPQKCNLSRNAVKWDILSNFQTIVLCGKCSCLRHKCHCIDPTTIV